MLRTYRTSKSVVRGSTAHQHHEAHSSDLLITELHASDMRKLELWASWFITLHVSDTCKFFVHNHMTGFVHKQCMQALPSGG